MSCLSTRLFSSPRRKPKHESDTTRIAERNFNDRNITRSRHISHRQRLASPPDCSPLPAANRNRKSNTVRITTVQSAAHKLTRSRHLSHRQRIAYPPDCSPLPAANRNRKSNTVRITTVQSAAHKLTRSRHLSHRQRLASPPDCFPTLVAKVAGKQRDSQCKKSNPLRTTSRAADTFQSANVLPLHPIVFLRSSQTATEKANASGVDCATLSATAPHTGQPRKERIAAHFTA
jgi:hypothetical protein